MINKNIVSLVAIVVCSVQFLFCQISTQVCPFNWADPTSLTPSYPAPNSSERSGEYITDEVFTSGPVEFTVNDDEVKELSQKARFFWGYNTRTVELRVYKGSYITVSGFHGYTIKEIRFEESSAGETPIEYLGEDGIFKNTTWTPTVDEPVEEVVFYVISTTHFTHTSVIIKNVLQDSLIDTLSDEDDSEAWYSLQGFPMKAKPSQTGLYLVRRGTKTTKRLVR